MDRENGQGEIIVYQAADGLTRVDVRFEGDTVWLTQAQLVDLYHSSKANISEHIKHILEEGQLCRYPHNLPSKGINFLEKCRNLVIEIDSILKQFKLFCKYGEIDRELFEIYTEHMLIANIPSILDDKYLYSNGDDFRVAANLLFSDQSIIYYIKGKTEDFRSFYEVLKHTTIKWDELQPYQKPQVNWLINEGLLFLNENGSICFDKDILWLMHDLYVNECICCAYMKGLEKPILQLQDRGMIRFGNSLLSEPEQKYFNYIFNSAQYDNSLDLRNKYAHGNQINDESINQDNYFIILRMLILIIIKINDEFCLLDRQKKES